MKQYSDPIEFAIEFAWANGCDLSVINKAKENLRKLKREDAELHQTVSNYNSVDNLIKLCEDAVSTGKWRLSKEIINDAKNNLAQLKASKKALAKETFSANQFATEEMNLYLETAKELGSLQKSLANPIAWARINERGDLYDLRLQNNPYNDQTKIVPLYRINHE